MKTELTGVIKIKTWGTGTMCYLYIEFKNDRLSQIIQQSESIKTQFILSIYLQSF